MYSKGMQVTPELLIGAVSAFATIGTIVAVFLLRARKRLSYEVLSTVPLLSTEEEFKNKLQIFFEGRPVQQVFLVQIKITNTGNAPIVTSDYERQVSLTFGQDTEVITAEVIQKSLNPLKFHLLLKGRWWGWCQFFLTAEISYPSKFWCKAPRLQLVLMGVLLV